jgi:hypothetical protein
MDVLDRPFLEDALPARGPSSEILSRQEDFLSLRFLLYGELCSICMVHIVRCFEGVW